KLVPSSSAAHEYSGVFSKTYKYTLSCLLTDVFCFLLCLADILDEATRKDLFTDAFCKVCSAVLQSESQRMSHYESKKHARKVCLYTQMHAEKDERQKHGKKKKANYINFQVHRSGEEDKYCCLCNMFFSCPITALSHYLGKIHAKNLKQASRDEVLMAVQSTQPWCRTSATCICFKMYRSHVQGRKHQIRATTVVNLTENSKKTYELTDCIQVPKATGLEQRTYLRTAEEEEFRDKDAKGGSDLGGVVSSTFKREQGWHSSVFSETQSSPNIGEKRWPSWPSACEHALEKTPNCNVGHCAGEQASEVATIREKGFRQSVAESKDYCKLKVDETFTSCYSEQKLQIKHSEEEKYISEELKCKKEATTPKRKESSEYADFGKENERQKQIKFDIDLVNEKKSKPYKGERLEQNPAEKESTKHRKDEEKPQTDGKTEELLWD
uniref:U1-type domain-containing protein n=2 Tax=Anas zonorhyncha TaxID=75864 RepID=A0A8B9VGE5_9AVES